MLRSTATTYNSSRIWSKVKPTSIITPQTTTHGRKNAILCQRNQTVSLFSSQSQVMKSYRFSSSLVSSNRAHSSFPKVPRISNRSLSSKKKNNNNTNPKDEASSTQELVLTPGEKVVAGTRLSIYAGAAVFAACCAYYIGKELLPTKMSPNTVFDKAFGHIRENNEVKRRFGEPLKAYGRDHGGHREGRRNFIEHTEYQDKDDGSKRTRIRFNLEGQYGTAFVFAEVSSDMPSGEFVYILVQDKRNGQVVNVLDNRSALLAKRMAGGNQEGNQALQNLLSGGK